jgi:DNA invertase Pin-like site-specific DNA recombinase
MTTTHQEGRKALRIAAYCRVASRAQADQQAGIEAQQSTISRYIEDRKHHHGWQVESLTFYTDAGESAKNLNGPGVQRLRRDVTEASKPSRARSPDTSTSASSSTAGRWTA